MTKFFGILSAVLILVMGASTAQAAIEGYVSDERGNPLAFAQVQLSSQAPDEERQYVGSTWTDETGRFSIEPDPTWWPKPRTRCSMEMCWIDDPIILSSFLLEVGAQGYQVARQNLDDVWNMSFYVGEIRLERDLRGVRLNVNAAGRKIAWSVTSRRVPLEQLEVVTHFYAPTKTKFSVPMAVTGATATLVVPDEVPGGITLCGWVVVSNKDDAWTTRNGDHGFCVSVDTDRPPTIW